MDIVSDSKDLAVLAGNGLSISCTDQLKLGNITQKIHDRISGELGENRDAFLKLAHAIDPNSADTTDDFESIVGVLEDLRRYLELTEPLKPLAREETRRDLNEALHLTRDFIRELHLTGITHVLEATREASKPQTPEASKSKDFKRDRIVDFVRACERAFPGAITFGNLNYDALLLSALLEVKKESRRNRNKEDAFSFIDAAVPDNNWDSDFLRLRETIEDFENVDRNKYRGALLHLHGSMSFVKRKKSNGEFEFLKLRTVDAIDDSDFWDDMRQGKSEHEPVVVLANARNKNSRVGEFPFNLAYKKFSNDLLKARHWLIVGYSFRDEGVNNLLRRAFDYHLLERGTPPTILVSDWGESLRIEDLEKLFSWNPAIDGPSASWLSIHREGLQNLIDSHEWKHFVE